MSSNAHASLSRRTNCCSMAHTPLSPGKNRIRRDAFSPVSVFRDVITISHGALDVLNIMGWRGRVLTCDIDPGVRNAIKFMRESNDYPDLDLLPPGESVQQTTLEYCGAYGTGNLGVVDIDLASCVQEAYKIAKQVIHTLIGHKYEGKVLLTFRNGRADGFKGVEERVNYIRPRLGFDDGRKAKVVGFTTYNSGRILENAKRTKGAAMCIVEIQVRA